MRRIRIGKACGGVFLLVVLTTLLGSSAFAQVKIGDMITYQNMDKVKDLVAQGVMFKLNQGMSMKIVPASRMDWPPPFKEATEKYSSQVRLSDDHRSLVGYVAGQPFPLVDPNDPDVGIKIAWNNQFRPALGDDYDLRFFDCPTVYGGRGKAYNMIYDITVGHYSGYSYVNRTEVEPMPVDPLFKERGVLWAWLGSPVISPQQDRGIGGLRYRYADPKRADDFWAYTPSTRRLRRINESAADMSTFPFPWNPDNYSGFTAKVEEWDFKFLGEKQMLAPMHAEHSPSVTCATDGGASTCPEGWEMRHIYIVEAKPRPGKVNALHSREILYMDGEIWWMPYLDNYDRKGQLWENYVYWLAYRDRPVPDAKVAIYPFKRAFIVGAASTDVQSGQTSMCYLPSPYAPERECWYISMGAVSSADITPQTLVKRGY